MSQQNCNTGMVDLGQACVEAFLVPNKLIAVQTYDSTGEPNEIDGTLTLDKAYFIARLNDTDLSKRWQVLPEMKNITDQRANPEFQTWNDGSKSFINQGIREFTGISIGTTGSAPQLEGKLNAMRGVGVSFFVIDKFGNLQGKVGSSATKLAPIEAESDTIYAILGKTQDKAVRQIMFGFDFAITEKDSELRMIKASEMAYNPNKLVGVVDVSSETSNITNTSFTVKLYTDGGSLLTPVLVQGLAITDFVSSDTDTPSRFYDETDDGDVTITGMTESPAGYYNFTFTSTPYPDYLVVKPVQNGFDFTAVEANKVQMPD